MKKISDNIEVSVKSIYLEDQSDPSEDSLLITSVPFIFTLFELQHRTNNYLPEYYGAHDFDLREKIISNASKKAFKIIVATNKDKELIEKFYSIDKKNNKLLLNKELNKKVEKLICNSFQRTKKISKVLISQISETLELNDLTTDKRHLKSTKIKLTKYQEICIF